MSCLNLIYLDYKKYKKYGGNFFTIVFFTQSFWAILQYRIAHSVYNLPVPILKHFSDFQIFPNNTYLSKHIDNFLNQF